MKYYKITYDSGVVDVISESEMNMFVFQRARIGPFFYDEKEITEEEALEFSKNKAITKGRRHH